MSVVNIAVVTPVYKVCNHVLGVLKGISTEVAKICAVADYCPDHPGNFVLANSADLRVVMLRH